MKRFVTFGGATLLLAIFSLPARGVDTKDVEKAIIQMEKDWTEAGIKKDVAALDRILADDWIAIDFEGNIVNKASVIADLKSGASTNTSVDLGEMKVRVYGDTAIVIGSDTEKSTYKGKDSSGHYVWTDVFVKRNGRWQAVSSQSVKTK
jgi:ketosteroid isomerase-like protein